MPFKSQAQKKFLYKNKPKIAKRWEKITPNDKVLPKKVAKKTIKGRKK